jgi:hypothetical protein
MPLVPKTYDINSRSSKFYSSTAVVGKDGYNPDITIYYDSSDNIVRVEEVFKGTMYAQTVSGSNYAQQWPTYSYLVVYNAWVTTTVS